ncbi:MAG TPA: hypothetical protein VGQ36_11630 [Thermoanaerobaculia bacterium]|jgi:hypothetical protein|nr:hypothetical protein [Thermoanaerobaculia bacterium]
MTHHWIIAALLLIAVAACREAEPPSAAAPTSTVATTTEAQPAPAEPSETPLDPTGAYFAMTELPAEFAELEHLSLATIDENAASAPLNGFLRPKDRDAKDYALISPKLEGRNLTFTTAAVDDVHYEFSGAFQVVGNFAAEPPSYETAVLNGTLTKFRDDRSVASTPVKFRYEAGG